MTTVVLLTDFLTPRAHDKTQVELAEPLLNCSDGGTFGRNWKCAKTAGPKLVCHIKVYDLSVNRSLVLSVVCT